VCDKPTSGPESQFRRVTFPATIPLTETAIKIHGDGGARIMLDVAESDLVQFLPAVAFRGMQIAVTFEEGE
jgi:hypothetical protein